MHVLDLVWKSVFHLSETKFTCLMKQLDIKGKGVIFVAFIFYIYKTLVKRSEVFVNNISEEFKIYIRFFFFSVQKYGCNIFILSFLVHHVLKKVFSGFVWIFFLLYQWKIYLVTLNDCDFFCLNLNGLMHV